MQIEFIRRIIVIDAPAENVVRRPLRLGCRNHDQPLVAPEFAQPALDICRLVLEDHGRDSRLCA
jgi:hypothetical protein